MFIVLDPQKSIVLRIGERLQEWNFQGQLFDFDEGVENYWSKEFVEENESLLFSGIRSSADDFDTLVEIARERPDLAYEVCQVVAHAVPTEDGEHGIWDYLEGFLNDRAIREVAQEILVAWSLSQDANLRKKALQMRDYFRPLRLEVEKRRIQMIRQSLAEIESLLQVMQDEDDYLGDESINNLPTELYSALQQIEPILSTGTGWIIRHGCEEVERQIRKDLATEVKIFSAQMAALVCTADENIRCCLQELSDDETLCSYERLWFQWALERAKSNDR